VVTIQRSSLSHRATLCHDRLRDPHAPELVFIANLAMRATASTAAYVADLKPHLERCILKSDLPRDWFRHSICEKNLLIADTASAGASTAAGRHSSALRVARTCAHSACGKGCSHHLTPCCPDHANAA
jgi:hypothetical protein